MVVPSLHAIDDLTSLTVETVLLAAVGRAEVMVKSGPNRPPVPRVPISRSRAFDGVAAALTNFHTVCEIIEEDLPSQKIYFVEEYQLAVPTADEDKAGVFGKRAWSYDKNTPGRVIAQAQPGGGVV